MRIQIKIKGLDVPRKNHLKKLWSKDDVVAVMEPIPGDLVMMHGVDRSRIESAFRPVRKVGDKTS